MLENKITDIFTEQDNSIFSENSMDPLGTRLIWTYLGNQIFGSKLNTISTDIRLYTLNLFHHYLVQSCLLSHEDLFINISSRPPYNNREDLYDGIIIFLECLLTQVADEINGNLSPEDQINVPGILKFKGIKSRNPKDERVEKIAAHKKWGILSRQILLGIHGRHKGPFREMEILKKADYYDNKEVWDEIRILFVKKPWNDLAIELREIIVKNILDTKKSGETIRKYKAQSIITPGLKKKYKDTLKTEVFSTQPMKDFWECRLGFKTGIPKILYKKVKNSKDPINYESVIRKACNELPEMDRGPLEAICAIEPFLACAERIMLRLLKRGTKTVDKELIKFIEKKLSHIDETINKIDPFINSKFLDGDALLRLMKLKDIFSRYNTLEGPISLIQSLIEYHKDLMTERSNLPWISISHNGQQIIQHRSYMIDAEELKLLKVTDSWINNYYLSTVRSLYLGLYIGK